jgi:hypothetical protein
VLRRLNVYNIFTVVKKIPQLPTKTGIQGTGTPETDEITRIGTRKSSQRQITRKLNKNERKISIHFKKFQMNFFATDSVKDLN